MQRIAIPILGLAAALWFAGCTQFWTRQPPPPAVEEKPKAPETPYLQKVGVQRETEMPLPTAVENALVIQDKYTRTLEDLGREQQRNRDLSDDNRKLADNGAKFQADLAKAQQELTEANNLLLQMRQELEKWKTDVLGFRDELRRANTVQVEALAKVLTLLGGEVAKSPLASAEKAPAAEKPNAPEPTTSVAAEPKPAAPVSGRPPIPAKVEAGPPAAKLFGPAKEASHGAAK